MTSLLRKSPLKNLTLVLIALAALFSFACATAPPAAGPAAPALNPNLVDPRLGFTGGSASSEKRFQQAWTSYLTGNVADAARRFEALEKRDPAYAPATLGRAAIAITSGDLDSASQLVDRAAAPSSAWTAAQIYRAEIAALRNDVDTALKLYTAVVQTPGVPDAVRSRYEELRKAKFESLLAAAQSAAASEEAAARLRAALAIVPESNAARLLLVQKLITASRFDEARQELEPLFDRGLTDRPEVQDALVDIDVGRGRYQEAIIRLERLQRRTNDPKYTSRLAQVKSQWAAANMPPQYQAAAASTVVTRADLAVLIYWHLNSVRFAQNLAEPPIAVDIGDLAGRDELVRALALRIFSVDPVTRTADPRRIVTGTAFMRIAARLMSLSGTPECAQASAAEPNDLLRAQAMLQACGVPIADIKAAPDAPLTGAQVIAVVDRIAAVASSEKR